MTFTQDQEGELKRHFAPEEPCERIFYPETSESTTPTAKSQRKERRKEDTQHGQRT